MSVALGLSLLICSGCCTPDPGLYPREDGSWRLVLHQKPDAPSYDDDIDIVVVAPGADAVELEPVTGAEGERPDPWRHYALHWQGHSANVNPVGDALLVNGPRALIGVHTDLGQDALLLCADGAVFPIGLEAYRADPEGYVREERWTGTWGERALELRLAFAGEMLVDRRLLLEGELLTTVSAGGMSNYPVWPPEDLQFRSKSPELEYDLRLQGPRAEGFLRLASGEEGPISLTRGE